jgi:hypothetical protein
VRVSDVRPGDRWLFLTPEAEAELPAAVATLAAAVGDPGCSEAGERATVERLIAEGDYPAWLDYLGERRRLLERYLERFGADAVAAHVAVVLNEQHMLGLTLTDGGQAAERERRQSARLLRSVAGADAR